MIATNEQPRFARDAGASAAAADVTVGVDLVEVRRLAKLAAQPAGLAGVMTERELEYCLNQRRPAEHLAARFAAKEAVLKTFGTGIAQGMRWVDVEILKERGGRPVVVLHGAAAALAADRRLTGIDVSLSHTNDLALAQAVAMWADAPGGGAHADPLP
jgi:holo-[acyl-carrier protein] synthase